MRTHFLIPNSEKFLNREETDRKCQEISAKLSGHFI
uniref:Uncharacterized protein n=1 Tax=Arundo donax TaxID=35708 RepID=A0A0A8Z1J8_ARUDO